MRHHRQSFIVGMPLTALPLVARLGTSLPAGGRSLGHRRRGAWTMTGWRLRGVATVLIESVFQLGNTVQQLVDELMGLLKRQRRNRWCRVFFGHSDKRA